MIEKLRSRHTIDLPAEGWKRSNGLLIVIGGIAALFVLGPLGLAFYAGALDAPIAIAIGVGALVLVLAVGAAKGKAGHARR